ncbi:MAG: sugar phosphate isomerase/epimerase [Candidatus Latescibacteria bacterium]|nr:sugar phosphate isomerase/epimerase [Candidatus Latescibacterota bacterium]
MKLGIFHKVFARPTLEESLDGVQAAGLEAVQFDLTAAGIDPAALTDADCERIRMAHATRGIEIAALSGTFNIIDPDLENRRAGMQWLAALAAASGKLGTELITFCTGTRNLDYMWGFHPDNSTPAAWTEMVSAMGEAVAIAEAQGATLVFEPEVNNVVDSAQKARRLLDEIQSKHLQVVIDGANLFHAGQLPRMREVLDEAFDLLGDSIRLAHAKDLEQDGDVGHQAAGTGLLDYDHYLACLRQIGFDGSLILHSLEEEQVAASAAFVREYMNT